MDLTTGSGTSTRGIHTAEPPSSLQLPLLHAPAGLLGRSRFYHGAATGPPRRPPAPASRGTRRWPRARQTGHQAQVPPCTSFPATAADARNCRRQPSAMADTMSAMDKVVTAKEDLASRHRYAALQRESFDGGHLASVRLQQSWFTRCTFRRADLRTLLEETHTASSTHQSREAPGSRPGLRAVRSEEAGSGARRARFSRAPRARMALDVVHVGRGPLGSPRRASRPSGRRTRPKLCASASR